MNAIPKTIQIFLPGGDPRGIRVAEITTRIVQVIEVPRLLLPDFFKTPESTQVGLYFLFGQSDDGADAHAYVGQTGDLRARLKSHNQQKDFWERATVVISRTNSLTQTHALFLEWHCLQEAQKAGRYQLENGNAGIKPHTPAPLEADCHEIFETARTLLSTLGFPIFDPVASTGANGSAAEFFYCKAAKSEGRGRYTTEGFVVLKGSRGRKAIVPSFVGTHWEKARSALFESGTIVEDGDAIVFTKDHLFGSPTSAAVALLGRSANGWTEWKTEDGRTLDAVKRQSVGE